MPIKNETARKEYQKKYKRKGKRESGLYNSRLLNKKFLCFDGETENQVYTLLGTSENYIYNKDGLSTFDCLNFLYNEGKGTIKIIFAIHFDVQHWIKDMPDDDIISLLDGETVFYKYFELSYITKRFLTIAIQGKKVYIYDICSFFQTSLLKTIESMNINLTKQESAILERGKKLRANNFKGMKLTDIIEYNKTECVITEKIADKMRNLLAEIVLESRGKTFNLFPSRFYGSGAVAKKILKTLEFVKYKEAEESLSNKIKKYIYMSYYGGRAEIFKIGTFKNIYKYDINSAYPAAMKQLKEVDKIRVKKGENKFITQYDFIDNNIYYLEFDYSRNNPEFIGILPYRRKDGYVMYPKRAKGYYWGFEAKYLNEINKMEPGGKFRIISFIDITYKDDFLFEPGFIDNIYYRRLELKRTGDIANIAYKLALNSLYGKLAQQTGKRDFTNVLSASFITAKCRAEILQAVFRNNAIKDIIQISTDGIFSQKKLDLPVSEKLGDFEELFFERGIVLGSGLYALYGKKNIFALRGLFVSEDNFNKIYEVLQNKPFAKISYNCFIGHKLSLANKNAYGKFRLKFTEITKTIAPFSYEKRYFVKKNSINKISVGYWYDIFKPNEKNIETNKLKKFDLDLEEESIQLDSK